MQRGLLEDEKAHLPRGSRVTVSTKLDKENADCVEGISHNTASKRRKKTFEAAKRFHSCPDSSTEDASRSAANGLWNTFVTNTKTEQLREICTNSCKVKKVVVPNIVNNSVTDFESSNQNFVRSVNAMYKGGILSKRKYSDLRSSETKEYDLPTKKICRTEFMAGCKVPALVA